MAKAKAKKDPLLETEDVKTSAKPAVAKAEVKKAKAKKEDADTFNPLKKEAKAVEKKVLSEIEKHNADLERFKKEIEEAPKTMFLIPLDPGEKSGSVQVVSLNGVAFTIKKGALVEIPVPIMEILAEKYEVEVNAGKHMLADRNDAVNDALS
jgi:hypothetical protein